MHVVMSIGGNMDDSEAQAAADVVSEGFKASKTLSTSQIPTERAIQLPERSELVYKFDAYNPDDDNGAVCSRT